MKFLTWITTNWKTTVQAILTVSLATVGYLLSSGMLNPKQAAGFGLVSGLLKVYIGLIQKD